LVLAHAYELPARRHEVERGAGWDWLALRDHLILRGRLCIGSLGGQEISWVQNELLLVREEDELLLEAAEEPSAIAGRATMEPNYVGLEPWVVLLRSQDARTRYVVVVEAHGGILGCLKTPMNEWESLYFYLPDE
jgi:hypothetical protein